MDLNKIYTGDCLEHLKVMPPGLFQCCVTSPPYYGLRRYIEDDDPAKCFEIGLEETPEAYVQKLVDVFREVRRVMKNDGTLWLNLGDSYNGSNQSGGMGVVNNEKYHKTKDVKQIGTKRIKGLKPKDLIGIPWMVAFALRADGWWLRQDIIWHKPNPMPESVTDRCTKAHEYIFLLTKSARYYYDAEAVKEKQEESSLQRLKRGWNGNGMRDYPNGPQNHLKDYMGKSDAEIDILRETGANKRSVWTVTTKPFSEAHFATFPEDLIKPCILAGCPEGGTVYDPFMGAGTTALVAHKLHRNFIGSELNPDYVKIADKRLKPYVDQMKLFK
jgi:DNA modification methylase